MSTIITGDQHIGQIAGYRYGCTTASTLNIPERLLLRFPVQGEHNARVIAAAQAASEYNVSFCIPEDQVNEIVTVKHQDLVLDEVKSDDHSRTSD